MNLRQMGVLRRFNRMRVVPLQVFRNYLLAGLLLAAAMLLVFAHLAENVYHQEVMRSDSLIIGLFNQFRSPAMTAFMKSVTFIGSGLAVISIGLLSWFFLRRYRGWEANLILISLAGSFVLNRLLKLAFHRTRPDLFPIIHEPGYSFPSAHAMVSFAFYGMLIYLVWTIFRPGPVRSLLTVFLMLLVLTIGISRIYLGVHYPSDVIAGFAAGGLWLLGCVFGLRALQYYRGGN
ncbi:MAG: phosphatase PAP2 family protein [Firmicutes bacterium]|nr:phosphatase PAP2 family protein [Bacillota bacterium]